MRFEGQLNLDLNEVTTNLVPYPRLHFLLSSLSPLGVPRDVAGLAPGAGRGMDQVSAADPAGCALRLLGVACRSPAGRSAHMPFGHEWKAGASAKQV